MQTMMLPTMLVLPLTIMSGCVQTLHVQPNQLPLLNGAHATVIGTIHDDEGYTTLTRSSVRHVALKDGRAAEIKGEVRATLQTRSGETLRLEHPIVSSLKGNALEVRAKNLPVRTIPLVDISDVALQVRDPQKTSKVLALVGVAGTLLFATIFAAMVANHDLPRVDMPSSLEGR